MNSDLYVLSHPKGLFPSLFFFFLPESCSSRVLPGDSLYWAGKIIAVFSPHQARLQSRARSRAKSQSNRARANARYRAYRAHVRRVQARRSSSHRARAEAPDQSIFISIPAPAVLPCVFLLVVSSYVCLSQPQLCSAEAASVLPSPFSHRNGPMSGF